MSLIENEYLLMYTGKITQLLHLPSIYQHTMY